MTLSIGTSVTSDEDFCISGIFLMALFDDYDVIGVLVMCMWKNNGFLMASVFFVVDQTMCIMCDIYRQ